MSNALAKILRGVFAALVLGISFPIAGQAQMHGGTHFDGAGSGRAHFGTAPARYYGGIYRRELVRHRVSSDYGAGAGAAAAAIVAVSRHGDLALTVTGAKAIGRTGAGTWRPVC